MRTWRLRDSYPDALGGVQTDFRGRTRRVFRSVRGTLSKWPFTLWGRGPFGGYLASASKPFCHRTPYSLQPLLAGRVVTWLAMRVQAVTGRRRLRIMHVVWVGRACRVFRSVRGTLSKWPFTLWGRDPFGGYLASASMPFCHRTPYSLRSLLRSVSHFGCPRAVASRVLRCARGVNAPIRAPRQERGQVSRQTVPTCRCARAERWVV